MTMQEMTKYFPVNKKSNENLPAYYFKDSLASAGNGDWVALPVGIAHISVILEVTSGEGYIEVTNDWESVRDDGSASGIIAWDDGNVTETTQSQVAPVVAIRQVNVSGTTKMFLQAQ